MSAKENISEGKQNLTFFFLLALLDKSDSVKLIAIVFSVNCTTFPESVVLIKPVLFEMLFWSKQL